MWWWKSLMQRATPNEKKSKAPWAAHGWIAQSQVYFFLCGKTSLWELLVYENICHLYCHQVIFMWNVLTRSCSANGSSDGGSQVCIMSQAVHQASTHSSFCSRKWLGVFLLPHPPWWDASPLQGYPQTLIFPVPIYTPEGILRHCESKVSRPRTQYIVLSQGLKYNRNTKIK